MVQKLETLLQPEPNPEELFSRIPLLGSARNKLEGFAQEHQGRECSGYLLAERDDYSGLVSDAVLASVQHNTTVSTNIREVENLELFQRIAAHGKKVIGWWHSHHNMPSFHSSTDDQNLESFLESHQSSIIRQTGISVNEYGAGPYTSAVEERDGRAFLRIQTAEIPARPLVLEMDKPVELRARNVLEEHVVGIPYAYSIVVNTSNRPWYAETMYKDADGRNIRLRNRQLMVADQPDFSWERNKGTFDKPRQADYYFLESLMKSYSKYHPVRRFRTNYLSTSSPKKIGRPMPGLLSHVKARLRLAWLRNQKSRDSLESRLKVPVNEILNPNRSIEFKLNYSYSIYRKTQVDDWKPYHAQAMETITDYLASTPGSGSFLRNFILGKLGSPGYSGLHKEKVLLTA